MTIILSGKDPEADDRLIQDIIKAHDRAIQKLMPAWVQEELAAEQDERDHREGPK